MENLPRTNIQLDLSRLELAHKSFIPRNSDDILVNTLEGTGAELGNQVIAIARRQDLGFAIDIYADRAGEISAAINYASKRLTELMVRQCQISWMKHALAYAPNPDVFAQFSDRNAVLWRLFMELAVKDFHRDASSLMDALALVAVQTGENRISDDNGRFPNWADVESNKLKLNKRREQISDDLLKIVDGVENWWPGIKAVRDLVTHRKYDLVIFGNSENGLLFQVYDHSKKPMILLPEVLYPKGKNVVDFDLYSAFAIAEMVTLFDEFGITAAAKMQIPRDRIAQRSLRCVDKSVAQSIRHLIGKLTV
jgi:hypothetical protein